MEREGKKHVENRNRKRSEMERYRARRDGENRENRTRKGNPPRSSRGLACTLPRGRGRGDTPFISLSPPSISRDVFVN